MEASIKTAHIANANITTAKIEDLAVTSAKINDLSATKLTAGTIDTDVITVGDAAGKTRISGDTIKVKDASNKTRAVMGDMYENGASYGFVSYAADGVTEMFNSTGITAAGIPDRTVVYAALDQTTADATITVGSGMDYETPQAAIDSLPIFINHAIIISIDEGTYGAATIKGLLGGGSLTLKPNGNVSVTMPYLRIIGCKLANIQISAHDNSAQKIVFTEDTYDALYIEDSSYFTIYNVDMVEGSKATLTNMGIRVVGASAGSVGHASADVNITNKRAAINAATGSYVSTTNLAGSDNHYALYAFGGFIRWGTDNTITADTIALGVFGGLILPSSGINFAGSDGAGAWTAWNPTITNLTKGSATITGAYQQIGKTVKARFHITWAADTSASGVWFIAFPVTPHADYDSGDPIGLATMRDNNTSNKLSGVAYAYDSSTLAIYVNNSLTGISVVSNTGPWTWATDDKLAFEIIYEAA
jgi:hypothetical protein